MYNCIRQLGIVPAPAEQHRAAYRYQQYDCTGGTGMSVRETEVPRAQICYKLTLCTNCIAHLKIKIITTGATTIVHECNEHHCFAYQRTNMHTHTGTRIQLYTAPSIERETAQQYNCTGMFVRCTIVQNFPAQSHPHVCTRYLLLVLPTHSPLHLPLLCRSPG